MKLISDDHEGENLLDEVFSIKFIRKFSKLQQLKFN